MSRRLLATAALITAFAIPSIAAAPTLETDTKSQIEHKNLKSFDVIEEAKRNRKRKGRNRVPGGSGCDSEEDMAEHPECGETPPAAGLKNTFVPDLIQEAKRRKQRTPRGSGCDSPEDIAEHPKCTPTNPA